MRTRLFTLAAISAALAAGCTDGITPPETDNSDPLTTFQGAAATSCATVNPKTVLVDPTHDGGAWWFPQATDFNADSAHQGKALADTLRGRGYTVTELGRGATMSPDSMVKYAVIIRAGYYYSAQLPGYSAADLAAYEAYTACSRTLIVLAEYLRDGRKDDLTDHLGIKLEGQLTGVIDSFAPHTLTAGVTAIPFIAGSYLSDEANASIDVLGRVGGKGVMGVLNGRAAKIFFIGDVNGIQQLPRPFVDNLFGWGF